MSKIVVLNSGGFDSVVLAHDVRFNNPEEEIHNLFFNYGQRQFKSEQRCSRECAEKLKFIHKEITLPEFSWSNSILSGGTDESEYIPMRNLILLSYALSYAESIGADSIYCAFINPEGEYYTDTSPLFLENLNRLSETSGITIYAPFINYFKEGLLKALAREYGVYRNEVHSCNYSDEPCGKCTDCECLDMIFSDIESKIPDDIFIDNGFEVTEDFISTIKNDKVTNAKLFINNACQFSCSHCFIGKHKLYGKQLSLDEWIRVIEELADYGVKNVDFFGKEPLFNDSIFPMLDKCKSLGLNYSLITNGVNVKKYIDQLEKYKPKMALSVETLNDTTYRDSGHFICDTLELLLSRGIEVSVSIDLGNHNHSELCSIINKLYDLGVRQFYVKPLRPFGEAEHYLMDNIISAKDMFKCMQDLWELNEKLHTNISVALAMMDVDRFQKADEELFFKYFGQAIVNRLDRVGGITIDTELYCHRFKEMVAITPEGYVLGCASEYCTDYSHYNNLKEHSFKECVEQGKGSLNENSYKGVGCYFCKEYRKDSKIFQ